MNLNFIIINFLYFVQSISFGCLALLSSDIKWTHQLSMETDGFEVKWDSEDPDFLTMEISAPTTGYLGVGFSPNGDMIDSDIVIAWVDSNGLPYIKDFHGVGKADPIEDPQQDYFLIAAAERDNFTIVRFHRRWETCDEEHDIKIGNDTMRLIWAWHTDDPSEESLPWHGITSRGTRNVFMRLPNRPLPFPDGQDGLQEPSDSVNFWDLTVENVDIDSTQNSLMMCRIFKFPSSTDTEDDTTNTENYQMIGFRPLITEENEGNIFRISVYRCHLPEILGDPEKSSNRKFYESSSECISDEEESTLHRFQYCNDYLLSWAFGSEGEMLPAHVGNSLGDESGKYFKLKVHYDNLSGKQFLDSSGIRIFYTNEAREFEGGTLAVGHRVSPFLAIPPSQEGFKIYSICSTDCTKHSIPETGLNVISVMLHTKEFGRKIRLRHIRKGKELSPIAEDGNFTQNYQQNRIMKNEVRILPGDELYLECEYSTLLQDKFTFGGHSMDEEICQALLSYYPKTNLTACESKPEFQSFFSGFGIRNIMGEGLRRIDIPPQDREDADLMPPLFQLEKNSLKEHENPFDSVFITFPSAHKNISVATRMNNINWKEKHVSKNLENSWRNGRYYLYCDGTSRIPYQKYVGEIPKFQKYKKPATSFCRKQRTRNATGKFMSNVFVIVLVFLTKLCLVKLN